MDVKILVATHKKYWMPGDDVYLPLHVGRDGRGDLGYVGDDSGENISAKNPSYCELTGLYWAWKNLTCDYIGLCHYRRYFARTIWRRGLERKKKVILRREDYESLLRRYDVILPVKRRYFIETVRSHYGHAHNGRDIDDVGTVIEELFPEYSRAFVDVMARRSLYLLNMFVMRRRLFDDYCGWLFPLLSELERRVDISGYVGRQTRVFGFLGERLFNVWLEKQKFRKVEIPVINLENVNWPRKIASFLKRKVQGEQGGSWR